MKARLSRFLYPLNLWRYSLACCHWFLRVYQRWLWDPFLEDWLSTNSEAAENEGLQSEVYTCVECGKEKKLALVVCEDVEPYFFCSLVCRERHALSVAPEQESNELGHPSI